MCTKKLNEVYAKGMVYKQERDQGGPEFTGFQQELQKHFTAFRQNLASYLAER